MDEQGTRVEITADFHTLLQIKLNQLKSKGVKGITLKKLVEQLCNAGLSYQEIANKKGEGKHQTEVPGIHYPPNAIPYHCMIDSKSKLKSMQEALRSILCKFMREK